jgi:hypothetical protein
LHKLTYFTLALLLYGTGVNPASAQTVDAGQRAFVERYVAALRSQESTGLRILLHPASLACMNSENRDFYDYFFAKELSHGAQLRGGYTLARFAPVDADAASAGDMAGMSPNPVRPTHEFQIDTPLDSKNRSLAIVRRAVEHAGTWFIVLGCPTAEALGLFRERRVERERQQAHAKQLAGELRDPLLSEIKGLLAQDRRIDAIKRYQDGANVDLTTAVEVINALAAK